MEKNIPFLLSSPPIHLTLYYIVSWGYCYVDMTVLLYSIVYTARYVQVQPQHFDSFHKGFVFFFSWDGSRWPFPHFAPIRRPEHRKSTFKELWNWECTGARGSDGILCIFYLKFKKANLFFFVERRRAQLEKKVKPLRSSGIAQESTSHLRKFVLLSH